MEYELSKTQKAALEYSKNRTNIILLMRMGKGKSLTALEILKQKECKKVLCIIPKSLFKHWIGQIRRFTNYSYSVAIGNKQKRLDAILSPVDIILINFEGVRILQKEIIKISSKGYFDCILIDELARVRRNSQQTRAIYNISNMLTESKKLKARIGLSGLLIAESLIDAFNPFKILDLGKTFGVDFFRHREKYFTLEKDPKKVIDYGTWKPTDYGKRIIPALIKNAAYIDVDDSELPTTSFVTRYITLSKEQDAFLVGLKEEWAAKFPSLEQSDLLKYTIQIIQKANQCVGGFVYRNENETFWFDYNPKLQELSSIIEELSNEQFVIMCNYKAEKSLCTKLLEKMNKKICPSESLEEFKSNNFQCYIGTYSKDSIGLNLGSAKTMILYSRPNSYELFEQSLGRIRRMDSLHKNVCYQVISSKHWTELRNDEALKQKKDLANLLKQEKLESLWT